MKKFDKLISDGWKNTQINFAENSAILIKGHETVLFDKTKDEIFFSYSVDKKKKNPD